MSNTDAACQIPSVNKKIHGRESQPITHRTWSHRRIDDSVKVGFRYRLSCRFHQTPPPLCRVAFNPFTRRVRPGHLRRLAAQNCWAHARCLAYVAEHVQRSPPFPWRRTLPIVETHTFDDITEKF